MGKIFSNRETLLMVTTDVDTHIMRKYILTLQGSSKNINVTLTLFLNKISFAKPMKENEIIPLLKNI